MKFMIFLLGMFYFMTCDSSTSAELGYVVELHYGQRVNFTNNHFSIKFKAVEEDSRCPDGAICVWEGNARIVIEVSNNAFELNTNLEPKETNYKDYKIRLTSVKPYPKLDEKINIEDYNIKLVVVK